MVRDDGWNGNGWDLCGMGAEWVLYVLPYARACPERDRIGVSAYDTHGFDSMRYGKTKTVTTLLTSLTNRTNPHSIPIPESKYGINVPFGHSISPNLFFS
jgi:hypothetical protein